MNMEEVIANSFKDFHSKGLDYICLRRSPVLTTKLYFFDGDVSKLPEVVNPHDHRYDFSTVCLSGCVENQWFEEHRDGARYETFSYNTPLNGGDGFEWIGTTRLRIKKRVLRGVGESYLMTYDELHTIRIAANDTVLMLSQYEDRVPVGEPTLTFTLDREPPSLSGLYGKLTADEIRSKLLRLKDRYPTLIPTLE